MEFLILLLLSQFIASLQLAAREKSDPGMINAIELYTTKNRLAKYLCTSSVYQSDLWD